MKLYKFYKNGCSPCATLTKILGLVDLQGIELVNLDVNEDENKSFVKPNGIETVPVLMFETGEKLVGVKKKQIVEDFIRGTYALSDQSRI